MTKKRATARGSHNAIYYCVICPQCNRLVSASRGYEFDKVLFGCYKQVCKCGLHLYLAGFRRCITCKERIECLTFTPVKLQAKFKDELEQYEM